MAITVKIRSQVALSAQIHHPCRTGSVGINPIAFGGAKIYCGCALKANKYNDSVKIITWYDLYYHCLCYMSTGRLFIYSFEINKQGENKELRNVSTLYAEILQK